MTGEDDKIGTTLQELVNLGAQVSWLAHQPVPLLALGWAGSHLDQAFEQAVFMLGVQLSDAFGRDVGWPSFRCVGLDRLPVLLRSGSDVEPSNSVIFVDRSASKALEYGGNDKLLLLYDPEQLRSSHCEVAADIDPAELAELSKNHPTQLTSKDGTHLWLSRLPEGDRRINSSYEIEYARWIPGDPWQALVGVVALGTDHAALVGLLNREISNCRDVNWRLTEHHPA
jgi:hypothetical protein